jgi:hypothetical protein
VRRNLKIYFDFRDWWIGYYKGDHAHYICLIPTVVIRWRRKVKDYGLFQFPSNPEIDKILKDVYNKKLEENLRKDVQFGSYMIDNLFKVTTENSNHPFVIKNRLEGKAKGTQVRYNKKKDNPYL